MTPNSALCGREKTRMTEMDCDTTMESVKDESEEGVQDAVHHLEEKEVGKECIDYEKFDSTMVSLKDGSEGEDGNASYNETINETMERFNDDSEIEAGNMSLDEIADTEGLFSGEGEDLIKGNESKSVKEGQNVREKPRNDLGVNQVEEKRQEEDVKNDLNQHKVQGDVKQDIVKETEETKVLSLEDWFQSFAEYRLDPELVGDKVENLHFNKNDDQAVTEKKKIANGKIETKEENDPAVIGKQIEEKTMSADNRPHPVQKEERKYNEMEMEERNKTEQQSNANSPANTTKEDNKVFEGQTLSKEVTFLLSKKRRRAAEEKENKMERSEDIEMGERKNQEVEMKKEDIEERKEEKIEDIEVELGKEAIEEETEGRSRKRLRTGPLGQIGSKIASWFSRLL